MSLLVPRRALALGLVLAACVVAGRPARASDGPYRFSDRVWLGVPAVVHAFDAVNGRLYSSAAAFPRGTFVMNTAKPGRADRLGETPFGPIDVAPDLNELFVLSLTESRVRVVDLSTRKVVHTFDAPPGYAVFYEPTRQDLYVLGDDRKTFTVIGAENGKVMGTIVLKGEPSFILPDRVSKRVYVRLMDQDAVQVIDPTERAVVATWQVDTFRGSTMAVDAEGHRLFVTSADNIWMLDTRTGERLAKRDVEHRVFGLAYDPDGRLLVASTPIGLVVSRADAAALVPVQVLSLGVPPLLFLDPRTHRVIAVGSGDNASVVVFERH